MNWENLTIGKKVAVGFGVVLTLLTVVGFLSYTGVGGIVTNAGQVIDGNKLDGVLAQKEVDHLNWTGKINALLTDKNVTELTVQTDDHTDCVRVETGDIFQPFFDLLDEGAVLFFFKCLLKSIRC